ncbi:alpha/beta hydrolase [Ideonella sp. DXS22W]|uniref:Alpha/beta hydrolase n=1 Tax=Pseudaquabacterium inlustre TaxID=2984192 RepID=A0ABU9CKF2_9BURK
MRGNQHLFPPAAWPLAARAPESGTPWAWPPGEDALTQLLDQIGVGDAAHPAPLRDGLVAVLNGLLGDHLQRADHALATQMQLRRGGHRLNLPLGAGAWAEPPHQRVVLLVHDLCLDEHSWQRDGHDYAAQLGSTLDASVLHLRYSSGLRISANGALLNRLLAELHQAWPVPLRGIDIVGHGMGGLVARSACAQAEGADEAWRRALRRLVFLGTPHHGLPLDHMRPWLRRVLGLRQASAPLARLARLRSDGVADLRHGNLLAADWQPHDHFDTRDHRVPVPLPDGVECHALAGCLPARVGRHGAPRQPGDGLVPVDSAMGRHANPARDLALPERNCWVGEDLHHLELLSHARVYRRLLYALSDA